MFVSCKTNTSNSVKIFFPFTQKHAKDLIRELISENMSINLKILLISKCPNMFSYTVKK